MELKNEHGYLSLSATKPVWSKDMRVQYLGLFRFYRYHIPVELGKIRATRNYYFIYDLPLYFITIIAEDNVDVI